jgi:putative ABC transport system permease protein
MFKNYLRTALRNLVNNKTYSFLNFFGLAIGVACAGIIFLWVENEMSYDNSYANRNRICEVMTNQTFDGETRTFSSTPGQLAPAMAKELPGIEYACRTSFHKPLFAIGEKSLYEQGLYADSSFLTIFSIQFLEGNPGHAISDMNSVIISERMAKQFFGNNQHIVGRTIKVDNKESYKITGVFKSVPLNSTLNFDWIASFEIYAAPRDWLAKYWGANAPQAYVLLSPSANFNTVNNQLAGFIHAKDKTVSTVPILFAMNDWHLRGNFVSGKQVGGRIDFVRLFAVIAWIVLIIACINFMNLATARSGKRAREVGVRKVLGAARVTLITQFIGESMAISVFSVMLGVLFMAIGLPFFNQLVETQIEIGLNNPIHIAALIAIAVFCGLAAGSYPSLYLSSFNPVYVFKGIKMKAGSAATIRKSLVIFQFTISIILIICTILVYRQVQHIKNRDLGYNKNNLLVMDLTGNMQKDFSSIRQDLLNTGVVENAGLCNSESFYVSNNGTDYHWEGKAPNSVILISYRTVTPNYLPTMDMQLLEGRQFRSDIHSDSSNVLITETLAKLMGKNSAVGKIIRNGNDPYTVVGVVKDYVYGDMYGKPDPVVFFSRPNETEVFYIRYKPSEPTEEVISKITAVFKKDNPAYPFQYNFVDKQFDNIFRSESLIGNLSRIFAALAILISCLGLFGLSAFTAEQRTKEIGIRKVLGANITGIVSMLSKEFLKIVLVSIVIATPVAFYFMNKWLQDFAYRISISWWVFVLAGFSAILIALLTVSFQAIRAAVANPVSSLRSE